MSEEWTLGRLLQWTADFLKERGADSPRLDAEVLLAQVRGCPRIALYTAFDELADETTRTKFRELVKQRAAGTPVAYLAGKREFYSLSFRVTPAVLIPRPETEFVAIGLLDWIKQSPQPPERWRIVDVGTGSGILAIVAARSVSNADVTAIDISPAALEIARANAADHGVAERIQFIESDLLAALPAVRELDVIVSNPPYVSTSEWEQLKRDVRDFEPREALDAGPLGTEVIERLIPQAAERLRADGTLFIEVSPMIEPRVRQLLTADGRYEELPSLKDLAGHARVVCGKRLP